MSLATQVKSLIDGLSSKRVRRMLLLLVGVYIGLVLYAHFFAESMIFLPPRHRYKDSEPRFAGQLVKLKTSQQETIAAVHLRDPDAKYTLLISHGNAEDIAGLLPMLKEIRGWGYNILAYDYPGYGASSGRPTEAGSYRAIDAAYAYLVEDQKVPAERIIALGRSLGGAMAIDLASRQSLGGLVAESTFISAYRVVTRIPFVPFDKFTSASKLPRVHCPLLVIHGRRDEIVGYWHGERLYRLAAEPKHFYTVEAAGHNDLFYVAGPGYRKALAKLVEMIEAGRKE